jgi:hypothetical protein
MQAVCHQVPRTGVDLSSLLQASNAHYHDLPWFVYDARGNNVVMHIVCIQQQQQQQLLQQQQHSIQFFIAVRSGRASRERRCETSSASEDNRRAVRSRLGRTFNMADGGRIRRGQSVKPASVG